MFMRDPQASSARKGPCGARLGWNVSNGHETWLLLIQLVRCLIELEGLSKKEKYSSFSKEFTTPVCFKLNMQPLV